MAQSTEFELKVLVCNATKKVSCQFTNRISEAAGADECGKKDGDGREDMEVC